MLLAGDSDDQISEAPLVGLDQTLTGIIDVATDVDMRAFTVVAGQTVAFDLDTQGLASPLTDSVLRLFNAAGTQLAVDDDTNGPAPEGNGLESFLSYTFATGGTYYIGVSAFDNFGYNPTTGDGDTNTVGHTGNYELRIGDPDDQILEAPVVTLRVGAGPGSTTTDTISHTHDVDMRAITVVAGQALWFDIDTQGLASPLGDSILRLFDAAGTELASSDDDTGPDPEGNFLESFLSYTFATGGTYYIGVSAYDNINYNATTGAGDAGGSSTGAYTLNINPADFVSYTFVGGVLTVTGTSLPDQITVFNAGGTVRIHANGTLIDTGRSLASVVQISVSGLGGSDYLELDSTLGTAKFGTLLGGDQDDYLVSSRGRDTLNGGNGNDWVDYSQATAGVKVSLALASAQATGGAGIDTLAGVENLWGSSFADTFTGSSGANILYGNGGNDILTGGAGDDFLEGGLGNDKLTGGIGNDTVSYLTADAGVTVNLATNTATGGAGSDTLATIENVWGSDFADTIIGNAFNNILRGFGGVDTIIGGGGVDTIIQD